MRLRFHPAAITESVEAAAYYDRQYPELGTRFEEALRMGVAKILENPLRWPIRAFGVRHYRLKGFPYSIIYLVDQDLLTIISVMHHRRRPAYWADRL